MKLTADRASGLFFLTAGVSLYAAIIPAFVEQAEGGWLQPDTVPNAVSIVLAFCGAVLVVKPASHGGPNARELARAALYFTLLAAGLAAISLAGFLYAAPVLALAVMLCLGERRPIWLLTGSAVMPAAIWYLVAQVLERALP
jgi:putative tricarboxylic transport membrane protein